MSCQSTKVHKLLKLTKRNLVYIGLAMAVIFLPYSIRYFNISLLLFGAGVFIHPDFSFKSSNFYEPAFLLFLILYLPTPLGYFYTVNESPTYSLITRELAFLIIPFLFVSISRIHEKCFQVASSSLIISCLIAFFLCLTMAFVKNASGINTGVSNNWSFRDSVIFNVEHASDSINWNFFTYQELLSPIGIHPAYISLYCLFCIVICLEKALSLHSKCYKVLAVLVILINSLFVLLIGSRMQIVILFLLPLCYFLFYFIKRQIGKRYIVFTLFILVILVITFASLPASKFRFKSFSKLVENDFKIDLRDKEVLLTDGIQHRMYIWNNAIKLALKRPLLGYGTEGGEYVLFKSYQKDGILSDHNSHNLYLKYFMAYGALGLLLITFVFFFPIISRNFEMNAYLLGFVIIIGFSSLTENILSLQKGIVFFAIFYPLLLLYSKKKKNILI